MSVPIAVDRDEIRGLGFVALRADYLEETIDRLLSMLEPLEPYPEAEQRWGIGRKINKAERLLPRLEFEYRDGTLHDLTTARESFEWRNKVIHGRIYGNYARSALQKSGRPIVPDRPIDTAELYDLANNLEAAWVALERPMIFQIPRAIQGWA